MLIVTGYFDAKRASDRNVELLYCVPRANTFQVLKWPVIFIGTSPSETPNLYSLMTYAGHALGTW